MHPSDVDGYDQCHFFAGIGGWAYALELAGWPAERGIWTGSCPCQPFSAAGRGGGFADERHLWPAFFHLICECRPAVVFGEQVASKLGLAWLDLVLYDLEGEGYAVGAADLCAAGVGAPHIRQRLFWVGDADEQRYDGRGTRGAGRSEFAYAGSPWDAIEWLPCRDGKARPAQSGIQPLAHGVLNRVDTLRGAGNAICPQVAAEFIRAYSDGLEHVP